MLLTLIMKHSGSGGVCWSHTKAGLDPKDMSQFLSTHLDLGNKSLRWQWRLGWLIRPRVLLIKCVYLGCTILEKKKKKKNWHCDFFLTLGYILWNEKKIQEFSSNDLNSTLCYAALLLSCGQLTCTDLTSFCHTERCGTDVNGQKKVVVLPLFVATDARHCRYRTCVWSISSFL